VGKLFSKLLAGLGKWASGPLGAVAAWLFEFFFKKLTLWWQDYWERKNRERDLARAREAHEQSGDKTPEEQEQAARDLADASHRKR
jgi:hypothetical protein